MTYHSIPATRTTDRLVTQFLKTTRQSIHAYSDEAAANKALFHRYGKALLKRIAHDLGYIPSSYDLNSNLAGIAVSGEITLHTDDLYVQFSAPSYCEDYQILYRRCQGRRDYRGLCNHFFRFRALTEYGQVIAALQALRASEN
jgi:hypothetical protein